MSSNRSHNPARRITTGILLKKLFFPLQQRHSTIEQEMLVISSALNRNILLGVEIVIIYTDHKICLLRAVQMPEFYRKAKCKNSHNLLKNYDKDISNQEADALSRLLRLIAYCINLSTAC